MPEDRPSPKEVEDDQLFDAWLTRFDRKMQKLTYERQRQEAKRPRT